MDDPYRDEDGEPLMDPDAPSDPELSPEPEDPSLEYEDDDWRRERSVTPVFDASASPEAAASAGKVRKRLVKKSDRRESSTGGFDDYMDDSEGEQTKKRKSVGLSSGGGKKEWRLKGEKRFGRGSNGGGGRYRYDNDDGGESEIQEMWNTIAGNDSENDQEGMRTVDDDNFIYDSGVDPAHLYGSDHEGSAGNAPQAEEGEEDEIKKLFDSGKKKKKPEKTPAEIALLVESLIAELEVMAEEDAELNREGKPAINKLKKLPMLTDVLSKKQLYHEFLDHGVLTLLKNWLEPLPDGSLPNINIRETILKILTDLPIDLEQYDRREQLKKSGLGKVVMFLSRSDEETTSNRKLAKELVDKWSRPIFNKSTRFEDMRTYYDERTPFCRSSLKKPATKDSGLKSRDDDFDLASFFQGSKSGQLASRRHASKPETLAMDFAVRPQSKIDPEEVRARSKRVVHDQRRLKMNKKLQQLKGPKKKQLQASKLSVEGRASPEHTPDIGLHIPLDNQDDIGLGVWNENHIGDTSFSTTRDFMEESTDHCDNDMKDRSKVTADVIEAESGAVLIEVQSRASSLVERILPEFSVVTGCIPSTGEDFRRSTALLMLTFCRQLITTTLEPYLKAGFTALKNWWSSTGMVFCEQLRKFDVDDRIFAANMELFLSDCDAYHADRSTLTVNAVSNMGSQLSFVDKQIKFVTQRRDADMAELAIVKSEEMAARASFEEATIALREAEACLTAASNIVSIKNNVMNTWDAFLIDKQNKRDRLQHLKEIEASNIHNVDAMRKELMQRLQDFGSTY